MSGGLISDNTATGSGGGVNNGQNGAVGTFEMSGGTILGNTAEKGGGVYNFFHSNFSLSGSGVISGNEAEIGGGVCIDSDFSMSGGEISGNVASNQGGGVYVGNGVFSLTGGKLSGNTATEGSEVYPSEGYEWLSDNAYSLKTIVVICGSIIGIVCGVILYVYLRQSGKPPKEKMNNCING
jgi:hypothetical protein